MRQQSWVDIQKWVGKSSTVFIKKLARNDCAWADGAENGHQNGVYIPREIRESGFFPPLQNTNSDKPHIFDTRFWTVWPATGEEQHSALKHYSNKGPEMHFTRVPRDEFSELTPASWLIGGCLDHSMGEVRHWFMVVDSDSEEAELLESMFALDSDFHFSIFDPMHLPGAEQDDAEQLIEDLSKALRDGTLDQFIANASLMPTPEDFALQAQISWLEESNLDTMDPWNIPNPGDVVMRISRDIEYALYKRREVRFRAAQVLRTISMDVHLASAVVRGFPELDATFLSASQTRKSRAGRSFEHHVARVFRDGHIRHEEQVILGGRRPDFVLPDVSTLKSKSRAFNDAAIVSLKTTLRERWKQLSLERINGDVFLTTVDDRVTADAISDMASNGICLVVPESLKRSKETCYSDKANVITFRTFLDEEISRKRPFLRT
jgi:hypothetical protein